MDDFRIQYVGIFNKGGYSISGGNTVVAYQDTGVLWDVEFSKRLSGCTVLMSLVGIRQAHPT